MIYIGSIFSADGRMCSELNRRLSAARSVFKQLEAVCKYSNITRKCKQIIYQACVLSLLMHCLYIGWLTVVEFQRLDAFYVVCLRRFLGILPAFISLVPDYEIFLRYGNHLLRFQLLRRQLLLYGYVVRLPEDDILRRSVLVPGDVQPANFGFRQRGAPRHHQHSKIFKCAIRVADGDLLELRRILRCKPAWENAVGAYMKKEIKRCEFGAF